MVRQFLWILLGGLVLAAGRWGVAQEASPKTQPATKAEQPIDFERARMLLQKRQRGEKLTPDEDAYLQRAIAERRSRQGGGGPLTPRDKIGLKPLTELTADERYKGQDGGLYGGGRNTPPEPHRRAAERELARIAPLDAEGLPDPRGRVVFVALSMSNATQEFSTFKQLADRDEAKSPRLTIVDCAQGGQAMAEWATRDEPWAQADQRLRNAQVSPQQVQVAWIKLANKGPRGELEEHARSLQRDTQTMLHKAKARFPQLRIAYLSSRIYGGYATGPLNPEPYAYESAFAARWLIQDQMAGAAALNWDAERGAVRAPLLLWGPYLWADGVTPRKDGLVWTREDLANDGTHPSNSGREKVARQLLQFFRTDPLARPWFVAQP